MSAVRGITLRGHNPERMEASREQEDDEDCQRLNRHMSVLYPYTQRSAAAEALHPHLKGNAHTNA